MDFSGIDAAVADEQGLVHTGNPLAEQRRLREGHAIAHLGDRRVLSVTGEDRLTWLDSITSQSLARLAPGESTEMLVLDPQGHVEFAASVSDDGATTWLIVDDAHAGGLLTFLTRMRFRLRVDPQDRSDTYTVIGGTPAALAVTESAATWIDPWPSVSPGGWAYAAVDPHPGTEREWAEAVVSLAAFESLLAQAAAGEYTIVGRMAAEALRVAAWRPRSSAEADGKALPHEADWLRTAVHLDKGCYRGQETVAKVHNLGHPPRRLVSLQLDGSDTVLPEAGSIVLRDGAEIGVITSAVRHFEEGPIALAYLKRTVPVDAEVTVRVDGVEVAAAQDVIVPPDAGRTANVPRLPRLGRRRA